MLIQSAFQDILIESDIIGQSSVKGAMSGKHYNRSIYCHKVMTEALQKLRLQAFLDSDASNDVSLAEECENLCNAYPGDGFQEELESDSFSRITNQYDTYIAKESANNPTFAFWSHYLEMTELLFCFIR